MWLTVYTGKGGKLDLKNMYNLPSTRIFCVVLEEAPNPSIDPTCWTLTTAWKRSDLRYPLPHIELP